jgi:hypothetical protein
MVTIVFSFGFSHIGDNNVKGKGYSMKDFPYTSPNEYFMKKFPLHFTWMCNHNKTS